MYTRGTTPDTHPDDVDFPGAPAPGEPLSTVVLEGPPENLVLEVDRAYSDDSPEARVVPVTG